MSVRRIQFFLLLLFFVSASSEAAPFRLRDVDPAKFVNSILALMSYSAIPDLASSSLAINNAQSGNPAISMTQFGGGFTVSKESRIYLEGAAAYSRYDPVFVATDGTDARNVPVKWTSGTLQGGVGYDFPIAKDWVIRPIFNFSVGAIFSDLKAAGTFISTATGEELDFFDGGSLTVGGLGGSMMLAYEFSEPGNNDIDFQLRYSYIHLQSAGGSKSVSGYSDSSTVNLYYRWRAPIDEWKVLNKPFRYVLEGSISHYLGDQAGVLGFDYLSSAGLGVELDSSAYKVWITRTRLVGRYMFGENVRGYSVGLACSF
ncbi:hypothetical protein [Bdellovibrio svalbardensis]|uniref:Autotransporter outer membrane beta-barrel domain-containing protein n=1 Tax=Bdellovibrio svalbardensis TaxID=2972972 RepID=A0ABT6DMI9_9BACT|nr:hypothetical protein [Bdellovibrio svalbardensis]MDG0818082.1 autotransporter outer membrane beta-barrel domain-containing protein [Bdellovibrio svalbardensis]